jgi:hypothetical protein
MAIPFVGPSPSAIIASECHHHGIEGSIIANLPVKPNASPSTIPGNGDVNPYGVAFVPAGFPSGGVLHPGDILVSNFNNKANLQGTGTTIVSISPDGHQSLFFHSQEAGVDTALGVLRRGFVIVGNVPTTDGTTATIGKGSLQIIDRFGHVVANLVSSQFLNGPWGLTIHDEGAEAQVFVANVLNPTVTRIDLAVHDNGVKVLSMTQIGSGYAHHSDPAALVTGPTGVAYDANRDILYVASTADNAIFAIPHAGRTHKDQGTGKLVFNDPAHLRGPLGLVRAPNGDLLTTNGDAPTVNPNPAQPSELIEFTPQGRFVGQLSLDPVEGAAFGLALQRTAKGITLATVNDDTNALDLRTIPHNEHR